MPIQKITSGIIQDGAVSAADIVSVSNTAITGNIISSQITSVANTQISGNIISSQIASVNGSVITANTIANSAIQTGAVENYMNAAGLGFGMRNRIINGAMVVDQRVSGTVTLDTNTRFIVDRFFAEDDSTATVTGVQSTTAPAGFINSMLFTVTTADSSITASENCNLRHWIEGLNVADLGWGTANAKTVTLSFWVRSSVTGTHSGALLNSATNRNYVFSYTISVADTWEQKSVTIAGDTSGTWLTTNGRGIGLFWNLGSGSTFLGTAGVWGSSILFGATGSIQLISTLNATFYITGVQLETGTKATSFDYRQYGAELALCQRYYQTLGSQNNSDRIPCFAGNSDTVFSANLLLVPMRSQPTLAVTGVMAFDEYYVSGRTQSSATVSRNSGGTLSVIAAFGNFSGTTRGNPGGLYGNTTGVLQISAEL